MKKIALTILTAIITATGTTGTAIADTTQKIETLGVHHIGLSVKDLDATSKFFIEALNFKKVGGKPDYPSIFISDGHVMITLWQVSNGETATPFDRKNNIGLHHLALKLNNLDDLNTMYEKIKNWPGVNIEFAPELMGDGPNKHMMFTEPGGIRLEFTVNVEQKT